MNSIEKKVSDFLTQLHLIQFFEYNFKFQQYFIDFADQNNKIAIEVQGTFHHEHFLSTSNKKSRKRRTKDLIKRLTLEQNGWSVIYIWEHSINKRPNKSKLYLEQEILKRITI